MLPYAMLSVSHNEFAAFSGVPRFLFGIEIAQPAIYIADWATVPGGIEELRLGAQRILMSSIILPR